MSKDNGNSNIEFNGIDDDAAMIDEMFDTGDLDETVEAERDVLGTRSLSEVPRQPEKVVKQAVKGLVEALAGLPKPDREAYDEAMRVAPRIVEIESPPQRFLLASGYDHWRAAQRLAKYWATRREVFGQDRYCLPLTISREGALPPEAVEVIKCGAHIMPLGRDRYNRETGLFDVEKTSEQGAWHDWNVRKKIVFYYLHILSESDLAVVNGIVFLISMKTNGFSTLTPNPSSIQLVMSETIPVKLKGLHWVTLKKPSFFQQGLNLWLGILKAYSSISLRMRVHFGETKEQIVRDLNEYGISREHLPERHGGCANFERWYEQRVKVEHELYQFLDGDSPSTNSVCLDHAEMNSKQQKTSKRKLDDFKEWAEDHLTDQKVTKLRADLSPLQQKNDMLKRRESFLEAQLSCAKYIAERYSRDKQRIHACLEAIASRLPSIGDELGVDKNVSFADAMLTKFLVFLGHAPFSGEWMFSATPWLSPYQQQVLHGVKLCLWKEQLAIGSTAQEQDQRTMPSVLQALNNAINDDESDEALDSQLALLRTQHETLKQHHDSIRGKNQFLLSSLNCVKYLGDEYDQFRAQHRGPLAAIYSQCFTELTGIDAKYLEGPFSPDSLADRVLTNFTAFDGQKFINTAVALANSRMGAPELSSSTHQHPRISSTDPNSKEILMSLFAGVYTPQHEQLLNVLCQKLPPQQQRILGLGNQTIMQDTPASAKSSTTPVTSMPKSIGKEDRRRQQLKKKRLLKRL